MRLMLFVLSFLWVGFAGAVVQRPEIAVRSLGTIQVTAGLPIQLSDLGTTQFVSASVLAKVSGLVLFESMAAGEEKSFSSGELVRILKEKISSDDELAALNFSYFVGDKVRVQAVESRLPENRITGLILQSLTEKCETCNFRLQGLKIPVLKERQLVSAVDLETAALKIAGSFLLPLRVTTINGEKTFYVTGVVIAKSKALVTSRAFNMGEKVSLSDVKMEEVEIRFANDAFATPEDLDSKTVIRSISSGRPLMKADLKKENVVLKGQMIRAISGNEIFEVSTNMQAEDSGAIGDLIKLKNSETQKLLSGKIIERGLVRIQ